MVSQAGADAAAANASGINALLAAAGGGHPLALHLLHRHLPADAFTALLYSKDRYGATALHFATLSGELTAPLLGSGGGDGGDGGGGGGIPECPMLFAGWTLHAWLEMLMMRGSVLLACHACQHG